jgi:PKD repeat protein
LFLSCFFISASDLNAQIRVLYLGNSYTYVNNLPQLVHDVALSAGDTMIFDSNTPGGYKLEDHSLDVTSQNKIMTGGWDYVVIQGQSQEPVMSYNQFMNGGMDLYNLIKQYNSCAVTMPYMTWGRKNGDAPNCPNFPMMCTYRKMDSVLRMRYLTLTDWINGEVSPVSVVWRYLRQNHPGIELYQPDESHPSPAGSYAAACCFYASLFKKDPTLITYNFGLNAGDASIIRNVAKTLVFDDLQTWNYKILPVSSFVYQIGGGVNEVVFSPKSQGAIQTYFWDFGDGITTTSLNPTHSYTANGTYTVSLTTTNCDLQGLHTSISDTVIQFCAHTPSISTSHPWLCEYDTLWTQAADSYQWFNLTTLPETSQYLADYSQYNISGFSVLSTLNGCSELSKPYTNVAQSSGYYFDIIGNPCNGSIVPFAVLHQSTFLSGFEKIFWYRNGFLLPAMNDQDTLFISAGGKYQGKVVDPNSNCAYDTTSYTIEFNCDVIGVREINQEPVFWSLSPNPASETITLHFTKFTKPAPIEIYNATGNLIRTVTPSEATTKINIADLPVGLYYFQQKNNRSFGLKFIKQ